MLNSDGIENNKKTTVTLTTTGLASKKTTLPMQHTFLYISLPLLLHNYNVKLSSLYTFYGGNVVCPHKKKIAACVPVHFLLNCYSFSSYWLRTNIF